MRDTCETARVKLNIGGQRFETTISTLTGNGKFTTFFTSLLTHTQVSNEYFIDRDGDAFGPLLSFLRTGTLHIPPTISESAVRQEADYFCIPIPPREPTRPQGSVRFDGMYLSFGGARTTPDASGNDSSSFAGAAEGEVRAYLQFSRDGSVVLGRREADGQWSALRCRYSCLAGGLLLVRREEARDQTSEAEDGTPIPPDEHEQLELSAVVLDAEFIEVITCGRVGRLENPFHFVQSHAPRPGSAFVSQAAHLAKQPAPGRTGPGRVVLAFQSDREVGVMVTSSHPGWSSATSSNFSVDCGRRSLTEGGTDPAGAAPVDDLWHLEISNGNFSRTVDFVSLGDHALVEFVQLNAQHEPQLIWYRPIAKLSHPWRMSCT